MHGRHQRLRGACMEDTHKNRACMEDTNGFGLSETHIRMKVTPVSSRSAYDPTPTGVHII